MRRRKLLFTLMSPAKQTIWWRWFDTAILIESSTTFQDSCWLTCPRFSIHPSNKWIGRQVTTRIGARRIKAMTACCFSIHICVCAAAAHITWIQRRTIQEFQSNDSRKEVLPVYSMFLQSTTRLLDTASIWFSPRASAYNGGKEMRTRLHLICIASWPHVYVWLHFNWLCLYKMRSNDAVPHCERTVCWLPLTHFAVISAWHGMAGRIASILIISHSV